LYDFYGALLTEHQQKICEAYIYDDLSLSEIADQEGISRQGVHDLLGRCFTKMQDCEERLHLMEQFSRSAECLKELRELLAGAEKESDGSRRIGAEEIRRAEILMDRLAELLDNT